MRKILRTAAITVAISFSASNEALEPRFDHRDQKGILFELGAGRDTLILSRRDTRGRRSFTDRAPTARVAFSFDVDDGDELVLGVATRLQGWGIESEAASAALDARYRNYFGSEEVKTFLELGIFAPVYPILGAGPKVNLGLQYDFARSCGIYSAAGFSTAFGRIHLFSFDAAVGVQFRLE